MTTELTAESYIVDFLVHGEKSTLKLEAWEQAYQDAGLIERAFDRGYIEIGRDVACTVTLTALGRLIAQALLPRKMFIWRGDDILRRYSSGTVAVIATDLDAAWAKLKAEQPSVWVALQTASGYVSDPADWGGKSMTAEQLLAEALESKFDDDFKLLRPEPEVFELDAAPVIVQWGGE